MPADTARLLAEAKVQERAGDSAAARDALTLVVDESARQDDAPILAEALRRLAVLTHQAADADGARALCIRSIAVARALGEGRAVAEALNALGGVELETGRLSEADTALEEARRLARLHPEILARIEQNLGIVANIRGRHALARTHYERSRDAFAAAGDVHGSAISDHNLGMLAADQHDWAEAERAYARSHEGAVATGDRRLQALVLLNGAEVQLALGRYDRSLADAEAAHNAFLALDARLELSDVYFMLGRLHRRMGQRAAAESRLHAAMEIAAETQHPLGVAEAARELARLYREGGDHAMAARLYQHALGCFAEIGATVEIKQTAAEMAEVPRRAGSATDSGPEGLPAD